MAIEREWRDITMRTIVALDVNAVHPELDTFDYVVTWGDGETETLDAKPGNYKLYHQYNKCGIFTPLIEIKTDKYGCGTPTSPIAMDDAPIYVTGATLTINGSSAQSISVSSGSTVTFRAIPVGCRSGEVTLVFVWGDDTPPTVVTGAAVGVEIVQTHIYNDSYTFNFQLKVFGSGFSDNNFPVSTLPVRFISVS